MWYHGTSKENWEKIQAEGVLWGPRTVLGYTPSRCTYLASTPEDARWYGEIILEIDIDLTEHETNWVEGCWQIRVYTPIPSSKIKIIGV